MASRGTELAVGYVSLVAETGDLSKGIDRALGQGGRQADAAGRKMGKALGKGAESGFSFRPGRALSGVTSDFTRAGDQAGHGFADALNGVLKRGLQTAGIAGGLAGLTAALTSSVRSGVEFTTNLNKLQGVTGATAAQMAQLTAKARELGNDTSLVGVSAQTAAEAMVELTKGGFSVQEAMDAAKGTLQLAAAAQVSAGQAATIQADALHAFGLNAKDAAKAADDLANVSNASTGEITDFAYGLQAGGAVAHQFGLSMEDTITTLGLLANAGIKGSDAGTLLKSSLLAITDQGNPAQGAIEELGLTLYDATGHFVGMRSMMEQLQDAAHRMSPEIYQAATNVLYGSDAARLAGLAAEQGGEGFDVMRSAIDKQGSAAALAAANTQGLPGVFERLSNTADRAKLSVFGMVDGPLQSLGNDLNGSLNEAMDSFETKSGVFGDVAQTLDNAWPAIENFGEGAAAAAEAISGTAWTVFEHTLGGVAEIASVTLVPALRLVGGLLNDHTGLVTAAAIAWTSWKFLPGMVGSIGAAFSPLTTGLKNSTTMLRGFRDEMRLQQSLAGMHGVAIGNWASAMGVLQAHSPALSRMGEAYRSAAANASNFGRTLGVAKAAMSGLSSAASGIMGLFGGPWGTALTAATVGVMLWADSVSTANQRVKSLARDATTIKGAAADIYHAFALNGGNLDDTVIGKVNDQVNALMSSMETARRGAGWGDWIRSAAGQMSGDVIGQAGYAEKIQANAEFTEKLIQAQQKLGLASQQISSALYSSNGAWDMFAENLRGAGEGGNDLLRVLTPMRQQFLDNKAAAANLSPGVVALKDQMEALADTTSTAEQRTNALKTAMDLLAGKPVDIQKAQDQLNTTLRQTNEAMQEAADQSKGFGSELTNADGSINTMTENGHNLYATMMSLRDGLLGVAWCTWGYDRGMAEGQRLSRDDAGALRSDD